MIDRLPYIYLLSHPFSGSTLNAFLIGSHPEIATVGEMGIAAGVDISKFTCSCGETIHACPFWTNVSARMAELGHEFRVEDSGLRFRWPENAVADLLLRAGPRNVALEAIRSLGLLALPAGRHARSFLFHRNTDFARVAMELQGGSRFLDISKRPNRLHHLSMHPALDVHVVHLIRDPRGVAYSCRRNLGMPFAEGARSWKQALGYARRLRQRFAGDRWLELRHEDICRDPDHAMGRVHQFVSVDPDSSFHEFRKTGHHIIGNRMRLGTSSDIRLDEKWKTALTPAEQATVMSTVGGDAAALGYE